MEHGCHLNLKEEKNNAREIYYRKVWL
jgi:hypothetical protein